MILSAVLVFLEVIILVERWMLIDLIESDHDRAVDIAITASFLASTVMLMLMWSVVRATRKSDFATSGMHTILGH